MYTPPIFRQQDTGKMLEFIRSYPFGVLCSSAPDSLPFITHLPAIVNQDENGQIILRSHLALANPHAKALASGAPSTFVFSGPHAYISPSLYSHPQNVPTWNYVSVHASGPVRTVDNSDEAVAILLETINYFEPGYMKQWEQLSPKYVRMLFSELLAFEMPVTKLEGAWKLSQNKPEQDRLRIAGHLARQPDTSASDTVKFMEF